MLKKIIIDLCRLELPESEIMECLNNTGCDLKDDLAFDSLLMVELVVKIETQYNFEFDMNDLNIERLKCFDWLRQLVNKYSAEGNNEN